MTRLAMDGGDAVRTDRFPPRRVFGKDDLDAVTAVFQRAFETADDFRYHGAAQRAYEAEFARYHGGGHALLVSSGTAALYVVLGALGLRRPGEVIVPAITDAGGLMPVPMLGLVPIVADTEPGSFNVGQEQIERVMSPSTRAVVVAHIGGEPVDMEPVLEVTRRRRLPVIEDCSQAHGARYGGSKVGTFGTAAVYSTMTNKHHCTGGQGGVIFTRDAGLHERIRWFCDRGKVMRGDHVENVAAGLNFNGNDLAAAIGTAQLAKLPGRLATRRDLVGRLAEGARDLAATHVVQSRPGFEPAHWFVRVRLDLARMGVSRTTYLRALEAEGIPCGTWADMPAKQAWFERQVLRAGTDSWPLAAHRVAEPPCRPQVPNAEEAADRHITLFVHERWTPREIDDVCSALRKLESVFLARRGAGNGFDMRAAHEDR